MDRIEHVDRLESRTLCDDWAFTKVLDDSSMGLVVEIHVRGQHVCQSARFASAHRIRLTSDRERAGALLTDAARCQVTVDDAVHFIRTGGGLIHALREDRDRLWRASKQVVEIGNAPLIDAANLCDCS